MSGTPDRAYRAADGGSERALFVIDADGNIRWSYVGQDGWEKVADYALDWAIRHAATGTPA